MLKFTKGFLVGVLVANNIYALYLLYVLTRNNSKHEYKPTSYSDYYHKNRYTE